MKQMFVLFVSTICMYYVYVLFISTSYMYVVVICL